MARRGSVQWEKLDAESEVRIAARFLNFVRQVVFPAKRDRWIYMSSKPGRFFEEFGALYYDLDSAVAVELYRSRLRSALTGEGGYLYRLRSNGWVSGALTELSQFDRAAIFLGADTIVASDDDQLRFKVWRVVE